MTATLALHGGTPTRSEPLPYGRQHVVQADIDAVTEVLRGAWLTTGPAVDNFERDLAQCVGSPHAIAVSSGTAALHAAYASLELQPEDEVIVPTMTFAATANAVVHAGGRAVFADVDSDTLNVSVASVADKVSPRTRAVVVVDFAGQPGPYAQLRDLLSSHPGIPLIADGCHALGASQNDVPVGALADITVFSFHPVKHITTGEGGAVSTARANVAASIRAFRNHGLSRTAAQRSTLGTWEYDIEQPGLNYRMCDMQAALGSSQLPRLTHYVERRAEIAKRYDQALSELPGLRGLETCANTVHAHHLYVMRVEPGCFRGDRAQFFAALRAEGIGVNVHYKPVHMLAYYRSQGHGQGPCGQAEAVYAEIITLPLFPTMTESDIEHVVAALEKVAKGLRR